MFVVVGGLNIVFLLVKITLFLIDIASSTNRTSGVTWALPAPVFMQMMQSLMHPCAILGNRKVPVGAAGIG